MVGAFRRSHLQGASMRLRGMLMSFVVAMALAMLPLAGSARVLWQVESSATDQIVEVAPGPDASGTVMSAMDSSMMDDCCLPHGAAGDPCKSAACCAVHCAGVAPVLQLGLQAPLDLRASVAIVRDQVLTSIVGSTPFRPPRI